MLNTTSENLWKELRKRVVLNKNIRNADEIRNETVRNVFKNSDLKIRNIYATFKFDIDCFNLFVKIENCLNNVDRKASTATFVTVNGISSEKQWNAVKAKNFKENTNDCNFEDSLIAFLIFRNRFFVMRIFSK